MLEWIRERKLSYLEVSILYISVHLNLNIKVKLYKIYRCKSICYKKISLCEAFPIIFGVELRAIYINIMILYNILLIPLLEDFIDI